MQPHRVQHPAVSDSSKPSTQAPLRYAVAPWMGLAADWRKALAELSSHATLVAPLVALAAVAVLLVNGTGYVGALLTAAKLDVARLRRSLGQATPETLARLEHLNASLDSGIALKRYIIEDLRPSSLDNLGLKCSLEIQLREFAECTGVQVRSELQATALSDSQQITVYRLVQEALTNIAMYASARSVSVDLRVEGGLARLSVTDDGRGFDPSAQKRSAHGLMGMRYRVEAVGGRLSIRSAPGRGTQILAELPLQDVQRRDTQGAAAEVTP